MAWWSKRQLICSHWYVRYNKKLRRTHEKIPAHEKHDSTGSSLAGYCGSALSACSASGGGRYKGCVVGAPFPGRRLEPNRPTCAPYHATSKEGRAHPANNKREGAPPRLSCGVGTVFVLGAISACKHDTQKTKTFQLS